MKYERFSRTAVTLEFILFPWILILAAAEDMDDHIASLQVFKCHDSPLNISTNWSIKLYSEILGVEVSLRPSQEPFPGCASTLPMEEVTSTAITPRGVLTVHRQMYKTGEYCLYNYIQGKIPTWKYCPINCTDLAVRESTLCVRKCCPAGKALYVEKMTCLPITQEWNPPLYDAKSWKELKPGSVESHSFLYILPNCSKDTWRSNETKFGLLTTGDFIYVSGKRRWETYLSKEVDFCADGLINENETFPRGSDGLVWPDSEHVALTCSIYNTQETVLESRIYMVCLCIASGFYLLTALIHLVVIDKQNVHGLTIFSLTLSMGLMGVSVGNAHKLGLEQDYKLRNHWWCRTTGILAHFFTLAAFTWLGLMNLDMWLTFRKMKPRSSGKHLKRFLFYCLAGFGAPLVIVVVGLILENAFPDPASLVVIPEYGQNICFVAEHAQGPYIYYYLSGVFIAIFFFFWTTCYKLWKLQKDTAEARKESSASDRNMGILFLRLSIVLGISWIFELISWAVKVTNDKLDWYWMIPDLYNLFTSILVFYIFVFKDTMLLQLEQRFPFLSPITQRLLRLVKEKDTTCATASSSLQNSATGRNKVGKRDTSSIEMK